jgi:predicted deacylase
MFNFILNILVLYFIFRIFVLFYEKDINLAIAYSIYLFIFLLFISLLNNYCDKVDYEIIDSGVVGPVLLIVTGSHGNEVSGPLGIKSLREDFKNGIFELKRGKLIFAPELNKCGLKLGTRWKPSELFSFNFWNMDLNRNYPKNENEEGKCDISNTIANLVKNSDYILDFHDGYSFRRKEPQSMGSGVYPGLTEESKDIAKDLAKSLNMSIPVKKDDYRKFDSVENWSQIPGSLRKYCDDLKKNYVLVETTGQTSTYPLKIRENQVKHLALDYCRKLNML